MVLYNIIVLLEVHLQRRILHFVGFVRTLRQEVWGCLAGNVGTYYVVNLFSFSVGEGVSMGEVGNTGGQDCFGKGCF